MKIFLDTANVSSIRQWVETGLIDGVTTNPTHLSKEGGDPKKVIRDICALLPDGHISVEVTEVEPAKIYTQAKAIAALADNVVVKVPCYRPYYPVIHKLVAEGIPLNITLIFSLPQGLFMAKLGVTYISPFIGRLDDIDIEGAEVIEQLRQVLDMHGYPTSILAASLRHVRHLHQAALAGADVVTLPAEVLEKAASHPLTDEGMETFNADWKKLGITQFP